MTQERYFQWMRDFESISRRGDPQEQYDLMNQKWREERKTSTPEELAGYAAAWALENVGLAGDPEFQAFMREMEAAFGKEPN